MIDPHDLVKAVEGEGESPPASLEDLITAQLSHRREEVEYYDGDRLIQTPSPNEKHYLSIGAHLNPLSKAEGHTLIGGAPGSGKTKVTLAGLGYSIASLRSGGGKVIVFSPKGDMLPLCHCMAKRVGAKLIFLDVSDDRAHALDLEREIDDYYDLLRELIAILIPQSGSDSFWNDGGRIIVEAIIVVLMKKRKKKKKKRLARWGFHHVFKIATATLEDLKQFINSVESNKVVSERLLESKAEETTAGILMNLMTSLKSIEAAAIHQYHTPEERWVSIRDVLESNEPAVIVIGQKTTTRATTTPIMRFLFKRIVDTVSNFPERPKAHTHIFIDEFPFLGSNLPGIEEVLSFSRSKHVHVTIVFQGVDQLRQRYDDRGANIILDNCEFRLFFRAGTYSTAEWASQQGGKEDYYEPSFGIAESGLTVNISRQERDRFKPSVFLDLKRASRDYGIEFVFQSPFTGMRKVYLSPGEVDELQPPESNIPHRVDKPRHKLLLPPNWKPTLEPVEKLSVSGLTKEQFVAFGRDETDRKLRDIFWQIAYSRIEKMASEFLG